MSQKGTTVQGFLEYLSPDLARSESPPAWPPDAFGLACATLFESGAYLSLYRDWPPTGTPADGCLGTVPERWSTDLRRVGTGWRQDWPAEPPPEISRWWDIIRSGGDLPLSQIGRDSDEGPSFSKERKVRCALLQLCAAADEASLGVGVPKKAGQDAFALQADYTLLPRRHTGSSLCRQIDPSKLRVLPKFHTPQTGMTLRSLSHNLALWTGSDVTPRWFTADFQGPSGSVEAEDSHSLNLLLIPWPEKVSPKQFAPAQSRLLNMPREKFGFFTYRHSSDPANALLRTKAIYEAALDLTDRIDGVIFPELALEGQELKAIREWVTARDSFLIAGVGEPGTGGGPGRNRVGIEVPSREAKAGVQEVPDQKGHRIQHFQDKHHRWCLDRSQIIQYGLGAQLDPAKRWWEHTDPAARNLTFVSLRPWLSLCALVCEDLARQDPVAHLVRAVGPSLVIALLMDGPQLASRWPARYATVLADDPGSSVLSLTSIGMCELSRPPGKPPSRVIALWKDSSSGEAVQIEMPQGASGVLLNLVRRLDEEWTADGRSDGGTAGYPALGGIHPVIT